MSLDGISMHPLSIELDRAIAGGRIDKINQHSNDIMANIAFKF